MKTDLVHRPFDGKWIVWAWLPVGPGFGWTAIAVEKHRGDAVDALRAFTTPPTQPENQNGQSA